MTIDLRRLPGTFRTTLLHRGLALVLASLTSASLLSGVASLADHDRAVLSEVHHAQQVQLALRRDAQR